ncbi:MAG: hypothetical protein L0271_05125, partial [Gemmatimonadetes bacterium]|nr:hypothetical protein [Gemmatimonadota bacterium]
RVFIDLIRESDAAQRRATWMLGAIIANHVVSAIDALVLARVGAGARLRLGSGIEPDDAGWRWKAQAVLRW